MLLDMLEILFGWRVYLVVYSAAFLAGRREWGYVKVVEKDPEQFHIPEHCK